jgi:hypothetical protein
LKQIDVALIDSSSQRSRSNPSEKLSYSEVLNCPENFSQQDMDERYVDTSFNGVNFIHESRSDLNDLPSPADFEEIISPASYGTCVSLKSLLDCKNGPHAGMATDSLKVFDLQRMIDNAVPFQTLSSKDRAHRPSL